MEFVLVVHGGEGFIKQQDFWLNSQCPHQGHALSHPAGELGGKMLRYVFQTQFFQQEASLLSGGLVIISSELQAEEDIILHCPPIQQQSLCNM